MKPKELGQIFWLVIPLLSKNSKYARPFLVYETNDEDYILLKISSTLKEYLNQFDFSLTNKPSTLYKEKNFVDPNILIYIEHELFSHKIDEMVGTAETKEQGQYISKEDFKYITIRAKECFSNEKFRGNRYKVRIK